MTMNTGPLAVAAGILLSWTQLDLLAEPSQRVELGELHLHYTDNGSGKPVILLHGGQGDYRSWESQIEALSPHYRVIAYSRRHHYPNRNPLGTQDHSAVVDAEDLSRFIERLGLKGVHLVGTSYGSFVALAFATMHEDRVLSMVLAEPPIHSWVTHTAEGRNLYETFIQTAYKPAKDAFAAGEDERAMRIFIEAFDGKGAFDRLPALRRQSVMANAQFFKALCWSSDPFPNLSKDAVRNLKIPTLVVQGEATDALHRLVTAEVKNVLQGAFATVIPDAGHGSPRQNPSAFNRAVLEFLRQNMQSAEAAK